MTLPLRIGTRASPLAMAQTRLVADALRAAHGWGPERIEIVPITTSGDTIKDRPLADIGGKALWTKELDRALAEGITDISVHSMKDVETLRPAELRIAAMLPRADVRDRLIGAKSLAVLREGATVGTASPRRAAQLRRIRPDLAITLFRGNVATRLARLDKGEADATLLAAAGLDRLGHPEIGVPLDDLLPAPSQGAVGIETLAAAKRTVALIEAIDHRDTHVCVAAERCLLEGLGADCHSPVAALAVIADGQVHLRAEILNADGSLSEAGEARFDAGDGDAPRALARQLLDRAAPSLRALFGA
ncbi:hydroxymethylbilane synthase [Allosphingosinicella indica]|uniref:Porphobilinogen deaminase n=1 Tax=Allosphingosinicella indica TaxID=941907 RepID=A0A1X7G3L5_9SPHN|nr:hydroxymethylbilane synthase [Allosphingosinicella indica]SMF63465.1 hydroxymethylbilane synthase [Allosphingosinicella indica]